jgi:hypothetical protein
LVTKSSEILPHSFGANQVNASQNRWVGGNDHMNTIFKSILLAAGACAAASAGSIVLDIDATQYGCSVCDSPSAILPGTNVTDIFSPFDQLTLGPGTYTITNADPNGTDMWGAWRFNSGNNWVWSFVVAQNTGGNTGTILMDDYVNGTFSSESGIANETGDPNLDGNTVLGTTSAATFSDTLVLASSTTLDFFIDDFELGDNAGGVALNISGPGIGVSGVPEPGTIGMMMFGLGVCAAVGRRFAAK